MGANIQKQLLREVWDWPTEDTAQVHEDHDGCDTGEDDTAEIMVTNQDMFQTPVLSRYCRQELSAPIRLAKCEGACDGVRWRYGSWSECSKTCGGGDQSRLAMCEDREGQVQASNCENMARVTSRPCGERDCPQWSAGHWSQCSVTCGQGPEAQTIFLSASRQDNQQ